MIKYTVLPVSPEAHLFSIELKLSNPSPEGECFSLPAWIPGSYMIRDFAKNIVTITASCKGERVALTKIDKQTWKSAPCEDTLVLSYTVYAWDLSVRSAHLDTSHGYFNGTSLFLRVERRENEVCQIEILPPAGDGYLDWQLASTMPTADEREPLSFGLFETAGYEELIDHPVEMGRFTFASFDVRGTPHEIAITGLHSADMDRLCRDLQPICESHIDMFGELPEMERYLFQVMAVGNGYGGLEHKSSTSLICKRDDLPATDVDVVTDGYRQFLGLCSHEYFHLWNVKRIRPKVFKEADLSVEVHSSLLWFFEGVTSYYDDLGLVRSGRIDGDGYLDLLAQVITRVMRGSGRFKQSVTESSFDAWTKFYKQDENAPNAIVSYYTKGALIALSLDMTIRRLSGDAQSLDTIMKRLWREYGRTDIPIPEGSLEALISDTIGNNITGLLDQWLNGTEDLPLDEMLATVGVGINFRPASKPDDNGGIRKTESEKQTAKPVIGARYRSHSSGVELTHILDDGAAQAAGLSAGDILIAVGGIKASEANIAKLIAAQGDEKRVHFFRRDELKHVDLFPRLAPLDTCELWFIEETDGTTSIRRREWLGDL